MREEVKMTNEDKINNMTNAELLLYMYSNNKCESCIYYKEGGFCLWRCNEGVTKWLKQTATEEKET